MRLGLDVNTVLSQGHRGIGHSTAYLVSALLDLWAHDTGEAILYYRSDAGSGNASGVPWAGGPGVQLRPVGAGVSLADLVRDDELDLLHLNDYFYPLYAVDDVLSMRFAATRLVITVNDLIPLLFPRQNRAGAAAMRQYLVPVLLGMDHVIAVSDQTRRDLAEHLEVGADRTSLIPLGVDRNRFHPHHPPGRLAGVRKRYGLERPFIFYVAGVDWRKNHPLLIEGFARFWRGAGREWDLVLAGHHTGLLLPLVEGTPWEGHVKILEYVEEEDVPLLYAGAGIFAFPSRYEGFGLPLLEAMASGVPVVASGNAGAVAEVAGDAALLADPDDPAGWAAAFTRLAAGGELRHRLYARGMERAASFTWEAAARRHQELYKRLIANR